MCVFVCLCVVCVQCELACIQEGDLLAAAFLRRTYEHLSVLLTPYVLFHDACTHESKLACFMNV